MLRFPPSADYRHMTMIARLKEKQMGAPDRARSVDGSDFSRDVRVRRLRELVARGEYVVDNDALASVLARRAAFTSALSAQLAAEARR